MSLQQVRQFRRLLVVNRGEIAVRILAAARELAIETYAVFTENDLLHTYNASHSLRLVSPRSYTDVSQLITIIKTYSIEAVHPGYGFLSESAEFAERVHAETNAIVIGPGAAILHRTADKLEARKLAEICGVPALRALLTPTDDVDELRQFARQVDYPVMVKALDGGGGRGIRLIANEAELGGQMARAIEESPSRRVFAEKAVVDGFHHVEIQIVGDLHGNIAHLRERDCSIQRRYQKIVEMAPSMMERRFVDKIIDAAMRMAKKIHYVSLGTFEFLANPRSGEFFFLEVNPRLQVEHTVTESIAGIDLVQAQILIAQGATLREAGLDQATNLEQPRLPPLCSLQVRITAEDVTKDPWSLSVGKIQSFHFPSGNGIRVDTNLVQGAHAVIGTDFDSLIAKLVITASTWPGVFRKARRALEDTRISGVKTNLGILRAIADHDDFLAGKCDTTWLQRNLGALIAHIDRSTRKSASSPDVFSSDPGTSPPMNIASPSSSLFRKGDAWTLTLEPKSTSSSPSQKSGTGADQKQEHYHHLELTKVLRNDFPTTFSADVAFTPQDSKPQAYTLHLQSTSASSAATALSSKHRRGSPRDPTHVIIPFSGKLVEFLVDVGDVVAKGAVVCVVKQMKMELEVRSARAGVVTWVTDAEDNEDVAEGVLAAIIVDEKVEAKL